MTGKMAGTSLEKLPFTETTWEAWKQAHPDTLVLSNKTGYEREYARNPYEHYAESRVVLFPQATPDNRFHPKEKVLGIVMGNTAKAYPLGEFPNHPQSIEDTIGEIPLLLHWDPESRTLRATYSSGAPVPSTISYWFAWTSFHPQTLVYRKEGSPSTLP